MSVNTVRRAASSLPITSSLLLRSVMSSSTRVRRSFSWATLPEANSSEIAMTSVS